MYKKKTAKKEGKAPKVEAPKVTAPALKPPSPPQRPSVDKFGHLMMVYFSKDKKGARYLVNKTTHKAFWADKSEDQLAVDGRIESVTVIVHPLDYARAHSLEVYGRPATPSEMGLK